MKTKANAGQRGSAPGNTLLQALSSEDFAALRPHLEPVELRRGQVLCEVGEAMSSLYFPDGALLSMVSSLPSGATVETTMVGRDAGAGCIEGLGSHIATARVLVQIPGRVWRLPTAAYHDACARSPTLRTAMAGRIENLVAEMRQAMACGLFHSIDKRFCTWLLQAQDRTGLDSLPVTQEFVAGMLGVRRTSITAAAVKAQDGGLIRYSRGVIQILDRKATERCACECYDMLRDVQAEIERRTSGVHSPALT
jgi:CRP-like cAMP-binding protein